MSLFNSSDGDHLGASVDPGKGVSDHVMRASERFVIYRGNMSIYICLIVLMLTTWGPWKIRAS